MNVRILALSSALLLLSACSLDIKMLGSSSITSPSTSVGGNFPLGEKKSLFGIPFSIAGSPNGNVALFDNNGSNAIILLNSQLQNVGVVSTYGTGDGQFTGSRNITVDANNNVYIVDVGNSRVEKFGPDGTFIRKWGVAGTNPGTPYEFATMYGIAVNSHNEVFVSNLYVAGQFAEIKVYSTDGVYLRTIGAYDDGSTCPGCAGYFSSIGTMAFDSNDNLYVADYAAGHVHKFNAAGTPLITIGSAGSGPGQFDTTAFLSLAVSPSGFLYVSQSNSPSVQKFSLTGAYISKVVSAGTGPGQVSQPTSVTFTASGDLLVADCPTGSLGKLIRYSNDSYVSTVQPGGSGDGQFGATYSVAVNSKYMVVADTTNKRLSVWDRQGNWKKNIGGAGWGNGLFHQPVGVGIDNNNNFYVLDVDQSVPKVMVQVFDESGTFLRQFDGSAGAGGTITYSLAMAVSDAGDVYVVDQGNQKIQKFTSSGAYVSDLGAGLLSTPTGIAIGKNNNLYVSDYVGTGGVQSVIKEISSVDPNAALINSIGGGVVTMSLGLGVSSAGNIYVTDVMLNRVYEFSSTGTLLHTWGQYGVDVGNFSTPAGLAIDTDDNFYVADFTNCRIQRFTSVGVPF